VRDDGRVALTEATAARTFLVEISDLPRCELPAREVSRDLRLFPGEGVAPLAPVAREVRESGYTGDVVVEVFNAAYRLQPPEAIAARAWRSANEWVGVHAEP